MWVRGRARSVPSISQTLRTSARETWISLRACNNNWIRYGYGGRLKHGPFQLILYFMTSYFAAPAPSPGAKNSAPFGATLCKRIALMRARCVSLRIFSRSQCLVREYTARAAAHTCWSLYCLARSPDLTHNIYTSPLRLRPSFILVFLFSCRVRWARRTASLRVHRSARSML